MNQTGTQITQNRIRPSLQQSDSALKVQPGTVRRGYKTVKNSATISTKRARQRRPAFPGIPFRLALYLMP